MTVRIRVPAHATPEEALAIRIAIESLLKRTPETRERPSAWAAAARREALDDRVR